MTVAQTKEYLDGYEERLYREVSLPGLQVRFSNVKDDDAKKIASGGTLPGNPIREKAFQVLADRLMPPHMKEGRSTVSEARKALLPMLTPAAAEGILQASEAKLFDTHLWIEGGFPQYWDVIVTIADGGNT